MVSRKKEITIKTLLAFILLLNILTWFYSRDIRTEWGNVPPVPSVSGVTMATLGDKQFAYRTTAMMLQNLGTTGGRYERFQNYDFDELKRWFLLTDKLDSKSSFVPYLAAFYYGSGPDPTVIPPLLEYLQHVGQRPGPKEWRWLAHAVWLARYTMKDNDIALKYAEALADLENRDRPTWTFQMEAFIQGYKGNKEEAISMLLEILESGEDHIHPNEINHTYEYICLTLLDEEEEKKNPLCQNLPEGARRWVKDW